MLVHEKSIIFLTGENNHKEKAALFLMSANYAQ